MLGTDDQARAGKARIVDTPPDIHELDAGGRLKRSDQNGTTGRTDEIQAAMHAVRAVDVGMTCRTEHSCVPGRGPTKAVGGRIVTGIGLGLDDPATDSVDQQDGSNQLAGDRYRIAREEGPGQRCCHSAVSCAS
jgi:hypothetical protein